MKKRKVNAWLSRPNFWRDNPQADFLLSTMWDSSTCRQICDQIETETGIRPTRNAVIGRASRVGLERKRGGRRGQKRVRSIPKLNSHVDCASA